MRTIEVAPRSPVPGVRLRPAPVTEPPYDDDLAPEAWSSPIPGQLALDWSAPLRTPAVAAAPSAPPSVVAGASHEARAAVRRFVAVLLEVMNGYRPAMHLRPLARPVDAAVIVTHVRAAVHRIAESRRGSGRMARCAERHGRRPDPVAVLKLRLCEPRPGAVEATVLLVTGGRTWALMLRMERDQASWYSTVVRLV